MAAKTTKNDNEATILNRKARHDYHIADALECGVKLVGTEVKAIREGKASIAEGYVRAVEDPPSLVLYGVHIAEYPPAGPRQHNPTRQRALLAHSREIRKIARQTRERGVTIVPLKMYFLRGRVKVLIGVARGRRKADKRQAIDRRQAKREIAQAMTRGRG